MKPAYALVDCNNFYASCERVFCPKLREIPIIVMSNNDGCVIARSNEVKALGIKMGVPLFKIRKEISDHKIRLFSTNFSLYGDISARVMETLELLIPKEDIEVYSIDESFLKLSREGMDRKGFGEQIKKTIYRHTGIPVSVGMGETKTLAKIACHLAKKNSWFQGVFDISSIENKEGILDQVEIGDVWGIGRKMSARLKKQGIHTALHFTQCDDTWVRKTLTTPTYRTLLELRGISCVDLESVSSPKKMVTCSRTFGNQISNYNDLEGAVVNYTAQAASRMRKQSLKASMIHLFIGTNIHDETAAKYSRSCSITLSNPCDYTPELLRHTIAGLKRVYKSGYSYKKAGVTLGGLVEKSSVQKDFFIETEDPQRDQLMTVLDEMNLKMGRGTLKFAAEGGRAPWQMRQNFKSPCYTTQWKDIPVVYA